MKYKKVKKIIGNFIMLSPVWLLLAFLILFAIEHGFIPALIIFAFGGIVAVGIAALFVSLMFLGDKIKNL